MNAQPNDKNAPAKSDPDTAELFRVAYDTLHGMAAVFLQRERKDHTLQPTALVHEAFLKLDRPDQAKRWHGKTHFQAVAARAMRQILVDHARGKAVYKRGGDWQRVSLSSEILGRESPIDLLALDEAMRILHELDARKSQVVELRFFGGLTCREAAEYLGISPKTVEADWYFARAWLRDQLSEA
jgi:RNA polymerase sigma factor (TIGR02999 family)